MSLPEKLSQSCAQVMYELANRRIRFDSCFVTTSIMAMGSTQPYIQFVQETPWTGVKLTTHLSPMLNIFLLVLLCYPVSVIPPMCHIHASLIPLALYNFCNWVLLTKTLLYFQACCIINKFCRDDFNPWCAIQIYMAVWQMKLPLNGAEYAPYKRVHISSQMWCSSGMWNFAHQCCIEVVKILNLTV
jgi:hypothetical protein